MVAIKTQSQYAALVGTKDPYANSGANKWEGKTKEGTPTQAANWGKILKMAEGESFSLVTPAARPSGSTLTYLQMKVRKIAAEMKFSYGFVWDLATLGGVSQRVEVRADERRITYYQRLLVDRILRRVRKIVLSDGVARQLIPPHPNMLRCSWHFGQRIITDVGYEVDNDLKLVNAGLKAADDVATKYAEGGGDLREILQRNSSVIAFAQQLAAVSGQPLEMLAPGLWPNGSQLLAAMQSEPPPPPAPGSQAAVGDKGAAQIVDILTRVSTGQMDRDSAVQTLVTVYEVPRATAEKIVPEEGAMEQPEQSDGKNRNE
jgi:hypothetical protein